MDYSIGSLILLIFILLSAFFSGSETALTTITAATVRDMSSKKRPFASYIRKLKKKPTDLLVTILVGNNVVNIAASSFTTYMFTVKFGSAAIGIATGIMTFLVLIFGEILPKSFANKHPKVTSQIAAPILYYLQWALFPIVWTLSRFVKKFIAHGENEGRQTITEDELLAMVSIGAEEGAINKHEQELIENILEFNDIKAGEVMTPRVKVHGIKADSTIQEAINFALEEGHSRYPVYTESLDNIIGIVSVKDLLKFEQEHRKDTKLLECKLRPALGVPHFKKIHSLFRDFQKSRQHMAVVVDEHGGTSGIITLEDLLEEIVGDIVDEHEITEQQIHKIGTDEYEVSGDTTIEDISEIMGIELPEAYYRTVNYLILKTLGRFPKSQELIELPECTIRVLRKSRKTIEKVLIKKHQS